MGENILVLIVGIAYTIWAIHAGNRVLTGHSEWLDRDATPNKICKFILALIIGSFIGSFYMCWTLWKWMARS